MSQGQQAGGEGSSSGGESWHSPGDDWAHVQDPAERRKIQNKLAQRRYRKEPAPYHSTQRSLRVWHRTENQG